MSRPDAQLQQQSKVITANVHICHCNYAHRNKYTRQLKISINKHIITITTIFMWVVKKKKRIEIIVSTFFRT